MLLGDASVGKTSSIKAYMDEKLKKDYIATIGVDVTTIKVPVTKDPKSNDNQATLTVWDLAGQEHFRNIRKQFYLGANAAFLIFDVTNKESFEHLIDWMEELIDTIQSAIPFFLVGNKIDLPNRLIDMKEMNSFADVHKEIVQIHETSALTGEGIRSLFYSCGEMIFSMFTTGHSKIVKVPVKNAKKSSKKTPVKSQKISTSVQEKKGSSTKKTEKKSSKKVAKATTDDKTKKPSSKKKPGKKSSTSKKKTKK